MLVSRTSTRSRRGLVRYAAAAAVVGMTLAGCGGESAPAPPPMESPSASSASPAAPSESAAAAPTMPPAAKGTSTAAAKAFVRHYVMAVNYAMNTGEVDPVRRLSSSHCKTCTAIVDRIEGVYESGGSLEGSGWRITRMTTVGSRSARRTLIGATVRIAPQVQKTADGEEKKTSATRGHLDFHLRAVNGEWRVRRLDAIQ